MNMLIPTAEDEIIRAEVRDERGHWRALLFCPDSIGLDFVRENPPGEYRVLIERRGRRRVEHFDLAHGQIIPGDAKP